MIYDKELKRVTQKLNRLYYNRKLKGKNIYIFGVSDTSRQIIKILRELNVVPTAVLDNDRLKYGSHCSRIPVLSLDDIEDVSNNNNLYIIYSGFWREMAEQLYSKSVKKNNVVVLTSKRETLIRNVYQASKGIRTYKHVVEQYKTNTVFLCPYTGTGDIYLIGTFWKEYCKRNSLKEYVFVVISVACKKVAELCGIENIYVLSKKAEAYYLIKAHMLWPNDVNLKLLNDCWGQIHTNPIEWFRGFKDLEFTPMFRQFVFDLPKTSVPQHPELKNCNKEIDKIMKNNKLIPGKTVVLSPYSNTLADIADDFWVKLTKNLLNIGYTVCTNSSGKTEPPVEGSVPIFFPLTIAPQFIEKAGVFIGVRSGFCDIVSAANAKKVILYDKSNRFYMGSAFEYFNLRDMQLCNDAIEIEYKNTELDRIVYKILNMVGE